MSTRPQHTARPPVGPPPDPRTTPPGAFFPGWVRSEIRPGAKLGSFRNPARGEAGFVLESGAGLGWFWNPGWGEAGFILVYGSGRSWVRSGIRGGAKLGSSGESAETRSDLVPGMLRETDSASLGEFMHRVIGFVRGSRLGPRGMNLSKASGPRTTRGLSCTIESRAACGPRIRDNPRCDRAGRGNLPGRAATPVGGTRTGGRAVPTGVVTPGRAAIRRTGASTEHGRHRPD